MASMVLKGSITSSCCNQVSLLISIQEKSSRNKRKFGGDSPLGDPNKIVTSPQNGCPSYEFRAEKFDINPNHGQASACDLCGVNQDRFDGLILDLGLSSKIGCSEVWSSRPREELEADWSDLTEAQLEELVLSNLDTIFKSAMKKIIACGYTEETTTKAVLMSGLCYGCKDTVSNIVDNTLAFLRSGHDSNPSRDHFFEDLQQLEKYILAELVCVLQEVRPFFSIGDAMWCLLICDMNVSQACAMDGDPICGFVGDRGSFAFNQHQLKTEAKTLESNLPNPCKLVPSIPCSHSSLPNVPSIGVNNTTKSKIQSSKREYILRQKSLHPDKNYKTYVSKASSRAKLSGLGGLITDKKLKPVSGSASVDVKNASLKIKSMEADVVQDYESRDVSIRSSPSSSATFCLDNSKNTSPAINMPPELRPINNPHSPALSTADTELSLSLSTKSNSTVVPTVSHSEATNSSYAGMMPYDKSLGQWSPRDKKDKKDEMIMKLVPRVHELQNQLQEWIEWANQKVMQAACRLSEDKVELKTLRQEKEEVERLKKEKSSLEENTKKKLIEMNVALSKASRQVERANATVCRLEAQNATLRREMEAAKSHAAESAASCEEVSKREKKTLMKVRSWEKQKALFHEELVTENRKVSQMLRELQQAKVLEEQLEARSKHEEKAKEEILNRASLIRKEREEIEASTKLKEDIMKSKAETNLWKYKEDIQRLEKEISQLRLKTDSSKIAALRMGVDASYTGTGRFTDNRYGTGQKEPRSPSTVIDFRKFSGKGAVKRERECVMCLSEEMSVVFIPCAHQVVCVACNELHEKQGMKDCPSCRSPIQRRIGVRYARS